MKALSRQLGVMLGRGVKRREPDTGRKARETFRREVAAMGATFTKARDGYVEVTPCDALPLGLTTAFVDWPDALDRLRHVAEDPSRAPDGAYSE